MTQPPCHKKEAGTTWELEHPEALFMIMRHQASGALGAEIPALILQPSIGSGWGLNPLK